MTKLTMIRKHTSKQNERELFKAITTPGVPDVEVIFLSQTATMLGIDSEKIHAFFISIE